jgi:hypothetical protein
MRLYVSAEPAPVAHGRKGSSECGKASPIDSKDVEQVGHDFRNIEGVCEVMPAVARGARGTRPKLGFSA